MQSQSPKMSVVARGFFTGLTLGVIARLWMRWISTDPEFTWSGSIFIVGAFTIFFTTQSIVSVLRRGNLNKSKRRIVSTCGVIFSLPMFMAAGGIMFPTVALASVALWTGLLQRRVRIIMLVLSLIIPARISMDIVDDFGWSFATVGRILLFILIYIMVIIATRPTLRSYKSEMEVRASSFSLRKKILISVGVLLIAALFLLFTVGIPGG